MRIKFLFSLLAVLIGISTFAQEEESSLNTLFQKTYSGEIWIVAIVAGVVILGLGVFLTVINKKVDRLEKES